MPTPQVQPPVGNFNYYPLDACITEAKEKLNITEGSVHDQYMRLLANRALLRMNSLGMMSINNITIDVIDGEAEMPNGALRFIAMRYCDEDGIPYSQYIADFNFLRQCACDLGGPGLDYSDEKSLAMINGNKIIFKYPVEAPKKIKVAYMGRKIDEDGFGLIYDYMVEAVVYFICHQFVEKYPQSYLPWQYMEWKNSWKAQHDRVVSIDARQSFNNNFARIVSLSHPKIITLL